MSMRSERCAARWSAPEAVTNLVWPGASAARSTRTVRTRNGDGLLQLPLTSVDVLHDVMRDAGGIRDLRANFDEAGTGQHPG